MNKVTVPLKLIVQGLEMASDQYSQYLDIEEMKHLIGKKLPDHHKCGCFRDINALQYIHLYTLSYNNREHSHIIYNNFP